MSTVTVELLCLKQDWDLRGKAFSHKKLQKVAKTFFPKMLGLSISL